MKLKNPKILFPAKIDRSATLRALRIRDAQQLFDLVDRNRAHLGRWLSFVDRYKSVSAARDFITTFSKKSSAKEGLALGIWVKNMLAGVITYDYFEWTNRATSIGYWLGEEFQGKGLVTRACQILVEIAFRKLGLNRVEIWCASKNRRCRAIPERLGFRQEGILRDREWARNRFVDVVAYSLLAREFRNRKS